MEQIYYTQEGIPYTLKSTSKLTTAVIANPVTDFLKMLVAINPPAAGPGVLDWQFIEVKTSRPIIPIMYNVGMVTAAGTVGADISAPYYGFTRDGSVQTNNLIPLSKMSPVLSLMDFSDFVNFHYGCKYGQAVFSEGDFITTQGECRFPFFPMQVFGMNRVFPASADMVVPNGTYQVAITTTYFELQAKTKQ